MSCLLATSMLFLAGCNKDNPDNPSNSVPDPEGTIMLTMANTNQLSAHGGVLMGPPVERGNSCFCMDENNNFYGGSYYGANCDIANVGKVSGLGSIKTIPASGYVRETSAEIGHGHVIRAADGTYARLYVVEWVLNTSGGILGAKVKYQYPWAP